MAPSLLRLAGLSAAAYSAGASAASYVVSETYDSTNMVDSFNFLDVSLPLLLLLQRSPPVNVF